MTTVKNIYDYLNTISPFDSQEEWDNSGFLLGDFRKEVKTVVLSLDATKEAVDYAVENNADLLLTHHPLIFNPIRNIEKGSVIYSLIENDIAVISSHTPFDKARGGINDNLASLLGLENLCPHNNGYIVTGDLSAPMSIDDFASFVGEALDSKGLRYTDTDKLIYRVAVGGGACGEFCKDAFECSDCFVTGDLKYHEMLDMSQLGYAVISAGHFETENKPFLMLKERLEKLFTDVCFLEADVKNSVMDISYGS